MKLTIQLFFIRRMYSTHKSHSVYGNSTTGWNALHLRSTPILQRLSIIFFPFCYPCSKLPYRLKSRFCNSIEIISIEAVKQLHGQCSLELDTQTTYNIYFGAYWSLLRTARYPTTVRKIARSNFGSLPPVHGHLRVTVVINVHDTEIVKIILKKTHTNWSLNRAKYA